MILSGLKTWLETGETLTTPGSLMYGEPTPTAPTRTGGTAMTTITDVRTIGVTVRDQDAALEFYVDTLGFEKRLDAPISPTMRWVEVAPRGATTSARPDRRSSRPAPTDTGIRFTVPDAEAERTALRGPRRRGRRAPAVGRGAADVRVRRPGRQPLLRRRDRRVTRGARQAQAVDAASWPQAPSMS